MITEITNKNTLGAYEVLRPSRYNELLEIWSKPIDDLSNIWYWDSVSGVLAQQYGGLFVLIFERLLRVNWLENTRKHELINHLMYNAGNFGSFGYFVYILSILLETTDITITPNLGDLSIIAKGGNSQLLANVITYEEEGTEAKLMITEEEAKDIVAQVESPVFGGDDAGGFLRAFLSNFLVAGDFASITLQTEDI